MSTMYTNDKNLRETIECPCYKLAHGITAGDVYPDHICQNTMQESCWQYLLETGITASNLPETTVTFYLSEAGLVTLENASEWPWTVQGYQKSVLMVLRQVAEHKASPRAMAALQAHPGWPAAKRSLHEGFQLSAMSYCIQEWKQKNQVKAKIPRALRKSFAALITTFEPPVIEIRDVLNDVENGSCEHENSEVTEYGLVDVTVPPQLPSPWPPSERLKGPTGLSKFQQMASAQRVLQQYNLTSTAAASQLLLSEVLPGDYNPPSAKQGLPKAVTVISFLLGDWTPALTASMINAELENIKVQEHFDPDGAAARRHSLFDRGNFALRHGGETIFQINGSSDWAKTDTLKNAIPTVNAHKEWWAKQATRPLYDTDNRKVPRNQDFDNELDDDEKEEVQKDIESLLAGNIPITEVYERAYKMAEEDARKKSTPQDKSGVRNRINRKIRDKKDKMGIPRKKNGSAKSA